MATARLAGVLPRFLCAARGGAACGPAGNFAVASWVGGGGTESRVEVVVKVVRAGGPPSLVPYLRDTGQRREAERQAKHAKKLALVASRTDNAVIITDVHGAIEWVNEGFTRISGYTL